jgi:hypothetical protein|tara:strand:+ start:6950 stop:8296 length:1347 start_codon:yes stop_codon:yes gene_type:complete
VSFGVLKYFNMNLKLSFHKIIIAPFFFVSILYYFLRFQFNFDSEVLAVYGFLQIIILVSFVLRINRFINFKYSNLSKIVLIFLFHTIFLTILTSLKTLSINAFLYSLKDYLFPVLLFWCVLFFKINFLKQLKSFSIISFIVSIIYLTDFYLKIILRQDPLVYLSRIRQLTMDATNSESLSGTFIKGDLFNFIRFEGPLGHNSPTSIFMAVGVFISFHLYQSYKNKYQLLILVINSIALIICANRTAIFSLIFTFFILKLLDNKNKLKIKKLIPSILIGISVSGIVLLFSSYFSLDKLFNLDSFTSGLNSILFNNEEISIFINNLLNPFSWIGTGFPNPIISKIDFIKSFRSDDFFILQLLNTYGILSIFLVISLFKALIRNFKNKINKDCLIYKVYLGIVLILFFSCLHAGSLIRPQIYPILFFSLAALHSITIINSNFYIENTNITE